MVCKACIKTADRASIYPDIYPDLRKEWLAIALALKSFIG
jgi:hypothetical protein